MSEYEPKTKKLSFILYYNNMQTAMKMLPDNDDFGELLRALCNYEMYGEIPDDFRRPQTQMLFELITLSLDENRERWVARCEINRNIRINSLKNTNGTNGTNGTDKEKEKRNDKEKEREKEKGFGGEPKRPNGYSTMSEVMSTALSHIEHK